MHSYSKFWNSIVIPKRFWIIAFLRLRSAVNNAILPLKTDVLTFVVWYNEMLDVGTVSLFFDWIIEDKINAMPVDKGPKIMVFRFNANEITRQGWLMFVNEPIKCQCCSHTETSPLICCAQFTGFYMMATLAFNSLKLEASFWK